mmetsp:Transcript_15525/g.26246  ORF Transcript_15525/g.26246 Transcript_15525/m.26246 type:complete len:190 (+) Transcript_15525:62-631(+)
MIETYQISEDAKQGPFESANGYEKDYFQEQRETATNASSDVVEQKEDQIVCTQHPCSFRYMFRPRLHEGPDSQKMVIIGHRGGFAPENTLHAFKMAKKHSLQAVELDIWITLDNQIVVFHGGCDGQMPLKLSVPEEEQQTPVFIYDLTLEEARAHFRDSHYFVDGMALPGVLSEADVTIPTLEDVFLLF